MKKIAILFLLLTTAVAFTFGQVALQGTFEVKDISQSNGKQDPTLYLDATGSASSELGPGSLSLGFELRYDTSFEADLGSFAHGFGDNFIKVGYGLPLGPGTLGANVELGVAGIGAAYDGNDAYLVPGVYLKPQLQYTNIAAGPLNLGVGAYYLYRFNGATEHYAYNGAPLGFESKAFFRSGPNADAVGGWFDMTLDFGLYLKYEYRFNIGLEESEKIVYLDINYKLDPLTVGVEVDDTHKDFTDFTIKPYLNVGINDQISAGLYVKFQNLNPDDSRGPLTPQFTPGVWIKYAI